MSIHKVYAALCRSDRMVVDNAWTEVHDTFRKAGYSIPRDDRAEVLVEALAVILTQSNSLRTATQLREIKNEYLDALEAALGIRSGGTTEDGAFSLETVNCLGACALAPVVMVEDTPYGTMSPAKVQAMLEEERDHEA